MSGRQLLHHSHPVVDPDLDDVDLLATSSSTAARASAGDETQCGAIVRPGSTPVMPRPAVKKRAAPGIFSFARFLADLERDWASCPVPCSATPSRRSTGAVSGR
jgi:hypothetical protein